MLQKTLLAAAAALAFAIVPSVHARTPAPSPSIADVATAACNDPQTPQFCILLQAVFAADSAVLERLSSRGQITVFAPTDGAFVALLGELGLDGLDDLDPATLTQVLLYHVVPGKRTSTSVLPAPRLRTLQGGFLQQAGGVLTDANDRDVAIIATDIGASNGVIHVIDRVLLP
jgi:uncharacterized surface protein with fasciclin (FAS1) repeats